MNLRKSLAKKLKKTGGFTLIEMLIVVAIIAILVAVSIPMVSASLNDAKTATDDANERAAKTAALLAYMNTDTAPTTDVTYCYDADAGVAKPQGTGSSCASGIIDYGKGSKKNGTGTEREGHVHVKIKTTGEAEIVGWSGGSGS